METPRLNHIAIKVKDLGASKEFYQNVLGLKVLEERPGKSVMLKDNYDGIICLILSDENTINGIDHFGFTFLNISLARRNLAYHVFILDYLFFLQFSYFVAN